MAEALTICLMVLAVPALLSAAYLAGLALLAAGHGRRKASPLEEWPRLTVLIPAHNEALMLPASLEALRRCDYPPERLRVIVLADNCTDETASLAREAGVEVWERQDELQRGKGYALAWAQERLLAEGEQPAAYVVLDADTEPATDFFQAVARELADGAEVVQGYYTVANPEAGWRPALMTCALALLHYARPLGRRALGGATGLKGNGMAFTPAALEAAPFSGESVVEDAEQTQRLLEAGVFPRFAPEAVVRAQMVRDESGSRPQRLRWEGGRYAMARRWAPRLLKLAWRRRRWALCDAAIDLMIPPLGELATLLAIGALGTAALAAWQPQAVHAGVWAPWAAGLICFAIYLAGGWLAAGVPVRCLKSLLWAPYYVGWKLLLYLGAWVRREHLTWTRTEREPTP